MISKVCLTFDTFWFLQQKLHNIFWAFMTLLRFCLFIICISYVRFMVGPN